MQRSIIAAIALVGLADGATHAEVAKRLSDQILTCWDLPAGVPADIRPIFMDLKFSKDGRLEDATVRNFSDDDPHAKLYAMSALRAVRKCTIDIFVSGEFTVELSPKDIPRKDGIRLFK